MSTETHVFFRGKLPSKVALARAMKELGFPFSFIRATGSLEEQSGFMPMKLRREETGVEFDVYGDRSAVDEFADVGVDPSYERRASFRWSGDFQEAVVGMCAAAALARLVQGVVFDEAENKLLSVDDAIVLARKNLNKLPAPRHRLRPGIATTLKRMLSPLLAKRSDLVLVGPLLLIRPVRHLMRGAIFRWQRAGPICRAAPYIRPLYQPSELFFEDAIFSGSIESPDFEAMLFDRLAADVFAPLGRITTIDDFTNSTWGKKLWADDLFPSLVLSLGIKHASALTAKIGASHQRDLAEARILLAATDPGDRETRSFRDSEVREAEKAVEQVANRQALLAKGSAAVLAHYRHWETKAAESYKIEEFWEPTPFPAEQRGSRPARESRDPSFTPEPWLEFPTTWREGPPASPGEVRFGRDWWERQGRVSLLHPISREQAEIYHHSLEGYTLMTRLPQQQLLILSHIGSFRKERWQHPVNCLLQIRDLQGRPMRVEFEEESSSPGVLRMRYLRIEGVAPWTSTLSFKDGVKRIWAEGSCESRSMTDADRSTYAFASPPFGEFDMMWRRIAMYLTNEGFGAFE
jgi:hypothetical protein